MKDSTKQKACGWLKEYVRSIAERSLDVSARSRRTVRAGPVWQSVYSMERFAAGSNAGQRA